jgi:hypothetical protein
MTEVDRIHVFCRLADNSQLVSGVAAHRKRQSWVFKDRRDITVKGTFASSSLLTIALALGGSAAMAQNTT